MILVGDRQYNSNLILFGKYHIYKAKYKSTVPNVDCFPMSFFTDVFNDSLIDKEQS